MIYEFVGTVPQDDNLHSIAAFCIRCWLHEKKKNVAIFIWEGQSLCEKHSEDTLKSYEKSTLN